MGWYWGEEDQCLKYEYVCTECGVALQPNDQAVASLVGVIREDGGFLASNLIGPQVRHGYLCTDMTGKNPDEPSRRDQFTELWSC